MKSMMVAVMAVIVGLSTGCAQLEQVAQSYRQPEPPVQTQAQRQAEIRKANDANEARLQPVGASIYSSQGAMEAGERERLVNKPVKVWSPVDEARDAMYERQRIANNLPEGTSHADIADAEELRLQKEWQAMERSNEKQDRKIRADHEKKLKAMTPLQRAQYQAQVDAQVREMKARLAQADAQREYERQARNAEVSAREQNRQNLNIFCHRNYGRSC